MPGRTSSPTIADVAREAGVSITTVSRILNDSDLVAVETVGKVRGAIDRLGYQPRSAARNLALRRTNTLGLLLESLGTFFFSTVVAGAEEAAYSQGFNLLIATHSHAASRDMAALGPFNTDGILAVNLELSPALIACVKDGFPIVNLYCPAPEDLHVPFVTIENERGVFLLIEHLIRDHGMRRIGFLRGPEGTFDSHWREQGFRKAMAHYHLAVDESLVRSCGVSAAVARDVILDWLQSGTLPQAVFTGCDETALYVMLALHELGIRVPEEIAVVGFDDTPLACSLVPPLTTVRAPIGEAGSEGIKRLLELIRTGETQPVTTLPTELVLRESCGCTASSDGQPGRGLPEGGYAAPTLLDERR